MPLTNKNRLWDAPLPKPLIIAHRGCSEQAPENTMAAFRKAVTAEADMIELDVRETADNRLVVIHDKRVGRTTLLRGDVRSFTAAELRRMDNGSWFSPTFAHERILELSEALRLTKKGMLFNIEIKTDIRTNIDKVADSLIHEVAQNRCNHQVIVTSFNHKIIKAINLRTETIATGILFNPLKNFRRSPAQLIANAHAQAFICSKYQINADVVADAHRSGCHVFVYGIATERDVKRMLKLEVDGLIANDPLFIRQTIETLTTTV